MNQQRIAVRAITPHKTNYPNPLDLAAGAPVTLGRRDDQYPGWIWVTTQDGNAGWAPESIIRVTSSRAGSMTRAYTARELDTSPGEELFVREELNGWLWVETVDGRSGWIPRETTDAAAEHRIQAP